MTLAEIRETDAPPEVDAIYGKLRQAYGLPMVNLIWRHFATLPGVLAWAWDSLAPAMPLLPAATQRVVAALQPLPRLAMGAEAAALAAAYNRGNLSNLVILTALLSGKKGHAQAQPCAPPPMLPPPPPLPRMDALSDKTRREILALAGLHGHRGGVIPTLYLHLAQQPALLAPLFSTLSPMMALGRIAKMRDVALRAAALEAEALRPYLGSPSLPATSSLEAARGVLAEFTSHVIPEMIPIGLMLQSGSRDSDFTAMVPPAITP